MSKLAVGQLEGLASEGYRIGVPAGSYIYQPGMILQVVSATKTDTFTTTSTALVDIPGLSVTLTPKSNLSKFLVTGSICWGLDINTTWLAGFVIDRNGSSIGIADADGSRSRWSVGSQGVFAADNNVWAPINFLDSPATSSAVTYKFRCATESPRTLWINRGGEGDGNAAITGRFTSVITVMEVAG
jgi:hypothetical protein